MVALAGGLFDIYYYYKNEVPSVCLVVYLSFNQAKTTELT